MKFKTLEISNIASIEKAFIDFQDPQFAREPIFLIYGETGSGKSVILDAICMALFRKTPRMDAKERVSYKDERFNGENDEVLSNDIRQYVRRGANEAHVQLVFEGNNGKEYTVRIDFPFIVRGSGKGKLSDAKWKLTCESAIYTKVEEINQEIKNAIGLTFEQFCRLTMLAQGEFTKFLESKEKDKSEILEKLTQTEIYSKIGAAIFQKKSEAEGKFKWKKKELEGVELLNDEQIAEINVAIAQCEEEKVVKEKEKAELEQRQAWLKQLEELNKAVCAAAKQLENAQNQCDTAETKSAQAMVERWESTEAERGKMKQQQDLREKLISNEQKERKLRTLFGRLSGANRQVEQEIQRKSIERQQVEEALEKQAALAPMFAETALIVENMKRYRYENQSVEKYENQKSQHQQALEELEEEIKGLDKTLGEKKAALAKKEAECVEKQEVIDDIKEEELKQEQTQCVEWENWIQAAIRTLVARDEALKSWQEIQNNREGVEQKIAETQRLQAELVPKLKQAEEDKLLAESKLRIAEESVGDYAKALRARLNVGDKCPVCGAVVEHLTLDEAFEAALKPVRDDVQEKITAFEELKERNNQYEIELKSDAKTLQDYQKNEKTAKEKWDKIVSEIEKNRGIFQRFIADTESDTAVSQLQERLTRCQQRIEELKAEIDKVEQLKNQLKRLTNEKEQSWKAKEIAEKALQEKQTEQTNHQSKIITLESLATQCQENAANSRQSIVDKVVYPEWEKDVEATIQRLETESQNYENQQNKLSDLKDYFKSIQPKYQAYIQQQKTVEAKFPQWELGDQLETVPDLDGAWSNLLQESSVLKNEMENNDKELIECQSFIKTFLETHPDFSMEELKRLSAQSSEQIGRIKTKLQTLRDAVNTASGALNHAKEQLQQHENQRPAMEAEETLERLETALKLLNDTLKMLTEENVKRNNLLDTNEENKEKFAKKQEELTQLQEELNRWGQLANTFGDSEGKKFRKIAQCHVLRQLLYNANHYLNRCFPRYALTCQSNSMAILVCDKMLGNEQRPVDNFSGGEKFIVSLALALGLSSLNLRQVSTDILFIDEGFGSLDAQRLDDVMGLLESLQQSEKRRIGIISHVEGLRERIPARLAVRRLGGGSDRSEVVMEIG